jgi:hypothetical protein
MKINMDALPKTCSICQGSMEEGFVLDRTYGAATQSKWLRGSRLIGKWLWLFPSNDAYRITAYRCLNCGHLEHYANIPCKPFDTP